MPDTTPKRKGLPKGAALAVFELISPAAITLLASCFWPKYVTLTYRLDVAYDLANPLVSVMAIGAGFVGASLSILSTADNPGTRALRASSAYHRFIFFHVAAISIGSMACLFDLAILARRHFHGRPDYWHVDMLWFFFNLWAGLCFIRVVYFLALYLGVRRKD